METRSPKTVLLAVFQNGLFGYATRVQEIGRHTDARQPKASAATRLIGVLCMVAAFSATGCKITKSVKPVPAGTTLHTIHVIENDDVLYKQSLLDELLAIIRSQGLRAVSVRGEKPKDATHHLTYQANWAWDLAMYLTYFKATLLEGEKVLGEVEYDARSGGASLGKFGTTADKIRPLLEELLKNVKTPAKTAVVELSPEKAD